MRTLVVWCPDWPVTAAGYGKDDAVVVMDRYVVAASKAARVAGVRRGMRRREAERYCPGVTVVRRNETEEAQQFEPVFGVLAAIAPSIEIIRPGLCALDPRGPARYFGGEKSLCAHLATTTQQALACTNAPDIGVGIAEGYFAATLAAYQHRVVARGATRAFLAPFRITALDRRELTDVLLLLGIATLGEFAALPKASIEARFGIDGARAYDKAAGDEQTKLQQTVLPHDFSARIELEYPADRVDIALFAARAMATTFVEALERSGLACAQVAIEVETEHGESLCRRWRAEYVFHADDLIQRLKWQLEGWLSGTTTDPQPTAGMTLIQFHPEEVVPSTGEQSRLFGGRTDTDRRAAHGADRLVGLLGHDAVFTGALGGGRSPAERSVMVQWGRLPPAIDTAPWPGRHPFPAPALIHRTPLPVVVTDQDDVPVAVSARGSISCPPAVVKAGPCRYGVVGWAGPWLFDERFWDKESRRRRARFQFLFDDGTAHLCFVEHGQWFVEATYD